jgi:metallo-beta-lactamase family protein
MMRFQSFGAAREVTGSKHLLSVGDARVLLDCGMFQGRRKESDAKNRKLSFDPKALGAVILSHGHCDHSGTLPLLTKGGYKDNIYTTSATRDIANLVLLDSAYLMARDYDWLVRRERDPHPPDPLFDEQDVMRTMDQFVTIGWNRRFALPGGVEAELLNSGHILGSSMVRLRYRASDGSSRDVLFTGDIGRPGMPIIPPPEPLPAVDYLICESTYGNRRHDPIGDAQAQLGQVIRETVKRGGKIIIPAFALGRTQELIYFLHLLKDAREIPNVDIYIDSPMAVDATGIFKLHPECYGDSIRENFLSHRDKPFGFEGLHYVSHVEESKRLNDRRDPCIVIAGSGMCEGGRILHHLKNNVSDPRNTILVVGYMTENTLGRAIADRKSSVKIFGKPYDLKARVKILNTFSGHADYEDLIAYVSRLDLKRLRRVYLVHGEDDALENLQGLLLSAGVASVEVVQQDKIYELE